MRYLCVLLLCFTVGRSAARTSVDSDYGVLEPPKYKGALEDIHEVAYMAAKRAFPEEDSIFKKGNNKVIIERDWFWRGDTIIEVWVRQVNENECIIEAESRGNWHRLNAALFNVSEGELKHYLSTLDLEYKDFKDKQGHYKATQAPLMKKLEQIKRAYEEGLITEEEYVDKKKVILEKFGPSQFSVGHTTYSVI